MFSEVKKKEKLDLQEIRRHMYDEIFSSTRKTIDQTCLPPSSRAAHFHGLRVYHQMKVWIKLSKADIEPTKLGWETKQGKLTPVMTDKVPALTDTFMRVCLTH